MGVYRRIFGAVLCFSTSVGGLYFYTNSSQPNNVTPKSFFKDLVQVNNFQIHKDIVRILPGIQAMTIRSDDVFIVTFPKSGTTWVQEIVYLILSDLDLDSASTRNVDERSPFLEFPCPGLRTIEAMQSPRLIKTHLPLTLLPDDVRDKKRARIIYVARNPRDVTVSYYHFCTKLSFVDFSGDFHDFFDYFIRGQVPYGPWWNHVSDYWKLRHKPNVLFITYEDLHSRNREIIKNIASFLGKDVTDEEVGVISKHCKFERMSENDHTNYRWLEDLGIASSNSVPFMRKGQVGDWKNYYDSEMCRKMDELVVKVDVDGEGGAINFVNELAGEEVSLNS